MKPSAMLKHAVKHYLWDGDRKTYVGDTAVYLCSAIHASSRELRCKATTDGAVHTLYRVEKYLHQMINRRLRGSETLVGWLYKHSPEFRVFTEKAGAQSYSIEYLSKARGDYWGPIQAHRKAWAEQLITELEARGE